LLDRLDEHVFVTITVWALLVPLIIFQALLSVRDDNFIHSQSGSAAVHPTATETFSPLLVVLGIFFVVAALYACNYKSAYQEAREEVLDYSTGLRVVVNF
jgi:predicted transporter